MTACYASKTDGLIAAGFSDGVVKVWDSAAALLQVASLGLHQGPVTSLALAPTKSLLVTAGQDLDVKVVSLLSPQISVAREHHGPIVAVMFAFDEQTPISFGADGAVIV